MYVGRGRATSEAAASRPTRQHDVGGHDAAPGPAEMDAAPTMPSTQLLRYRTR